MWSADGGGVGGEVVGEVRKVRRVREVMRVRNEREVGSATEKRA